MNAKQIIFIILSSLIIISCDSPKLLIVKASNNPNNSVVLYARENSEQSKKACNKTTLADTVVMRDTTYICGFGNWKNDSLVYRFTQNFDSIVITSNNEKIVLNKHSDISAYFLKNRKGITKKKLLVEAK